MTHDFHDNDDVLFDRLVDGELSADERRQLAGVARRPRRRLAAMCAGVSRSRSRGAARCGAWWPSGVAPQSHCVLATPAHRVEAGAMTQLLPRRGWRRRRDCWWRSRLGWQIERPARAPMSPLLVAEQPIAVGASADREAASLPDADAVTLVVQDRDGVPQRVQVPLVEGSQLGRAVRRRAAWAAPAGPRTACRARARPASAPPLRPAVLRARGSSRSR